MKSVETCNCCILQEVFFLLFFFFLTFLNCWHIIFMDKYDLIDSASTQTSKINFTTLPIHTHLQNTIP